MKEKKKSQRKTNVKTVLKESMKSLTSAQKLISSAKSANTGKRKKRRRIWNLRSKLIPAIRRIWFFSPLRREAIKRAEGKCEKCGKTWDKLVVDHIAPVIPVTGWVSWDSYLERMFPDVSGIQAICTTCHDEKSAEENKLRKEHRKNKKDGI